MGSVERVSVDPLQNPADGGLTGRLEPAVQRVVPDSQAGQDVRRRTVASFFSGLGQLLAELHEYS